jgi:hypothetical protein
MDHLVEGARVYFYRPPSVLDVVKKTRKAKHIDHYVGPAVIVKKIGSRSFQISYTNPLTGTTQFLQRDAGIIILKKEWLPPSLAPVETRLTPKKHQEGMELHVHVGEMVIMMDYTDAKDWYVAEVAHVLGDRFTVNGFTSTGVPLAGYKAASRKDRARALHGITYHRTWCRDKGKGEGTGTIIPPGHISKEGISTYGTGGSPSARRISCCSSGTSSWTRMDVCAGSPGI